MGKLEEKLKKFSNEFCNYLEEDDCEVECKSIDYGLLFSVRRFKKTGKVTVYYSPKKGEFTVTPPVSQDLKFAKYLYNSACRIADLPESERYEIGAPGDEGHFYSAIKEIDTFIISKLDELMEQGFFLENSKQIPYGVKFDVRGRKGELYPVNIYHSKKKGISVVVGGQDKLPLKQDLQSLLIPDRVKEKEGKVDLGDHYAGTDEAGKGEYFGPLVIAGFLWDESIKEDLQDLKVQDSKNLNEKSIRKKASFLYSKFKDRIEVVEILPQKYNQLFERFGKNSNSLLAWGHARVIKNFREGKGIDVALVDKFAAKNKVENALKGLEKMELVQKSRAERYPGVAAASIIARDRYIYRMEKLSEEYDIKLAFGSNVNTVRVGKNFIEKHSFETLSKVAKLHFQNTQKIKERVEED